MLLSITGLNIFIGLFMGLSGGAQIESSAKILADDFNYIKTEIDSDTIELELSCHLIGLINYYDVDVSVDDFTMFDDTVKFKFENIYETIQNKITIDYFSIMFNPTFIGVQDYDTLSWYMDIECELSYSDRLNNYILSSTVYIEVDEPLDNVKSHEIAVLPNYIDLVPSDESNYNKGFSEGKQEGIKEGYQSGYNDGKEEGEREGYEAGYNQGLAAGGGNSTANGIQAFLGGIFGAIDAFLSVEIIPGLSLWAICLIPIMFGVLSFFLNLWR